jgi:hypothetical protein
MGTLSQFPWSANATGTTLRHGAKQVATGFAAAVLVLTGLAGAPARSGAADLLVTRSVYVGANNASGNPLQVGDALPNSTGVTAVRILGDPARLLAGQIRQG